jgi:hypothetical protein
MYRLLTAVLIAGIAVVPVAAQRAASTGHAGGFSASHGFSAPHMSGGFNTGTHFSPAPVMNQRNFSAPPRYNWSTPAHSTGSSRPSYSNGNRYSPQPPDNHRGRPPYPASRYRQPYVPYFYANSTYLVPGLLNSYWDTPDNTYSGDQSASTVQGQDQGQVQNNGDYAPESAPYETQQAQDVPPPPPGPVEPLPQAAVTIVFKDGHSQQIHNYAMTKTTIYVLDDAASGRRPAIALDQIDVSATERTNRQAGVDFAIPAAE